jgi:1-acyl-sn-glycerol-3-phosphate acyltransferase
MYWKVLQWKMLVFLVPFCPVHGQMVYFMAIWYIFWSLGTYFSRFGMLCVPRKNLATLVECRQQV